MKSLPLSLALLGSATTLAADSNLPKFQPPFSFPRWEGVQPDLSLRGANPAAPLPLATDHARALPPPDAPVAKPAKPLFGMPIIVPPANLDPQMVKTPDPSIDYKIIVIPANPPPAK
jgi:hypothetical protein